MTKAQKLLTKLKNANNGFSWNDLVTLLLHLGFTQIEGNGSRVKFIKDDLIINLHKPHPQKEIKNYALKQIKEILKSEHYL